MKPALLSVAEIAAVMGLGVNELAYTARHSENHYYPTRHLAIPGKNKLRVIDEPRRRMKKRLASLRRFLDSVIPPCSAAIGTTKGRPYTSGASRHLDRAGIVTRDIKNCFPSVTPSLVHEKLKDFGFRAPVAKLLTRLMTVRGRIPQGSPLSNVALNMLMASTDTFLIRWCRARGARYHRVADDLIISLRDATLRQEAEEVLESQILKLGLTISTTKRETLGWQDASGTQLVHGIDVSSALGTQIAERRRSELREICDLFVRRCKCGPDHLAIIELAELRKQIVGKISYFNQAAKSGTKHFRRLVSAGDRAVLSRLEVCGCRPWKNKWWFRSNRRDELTLAINALRGE